MSRNLDIIAVAFIVVFSWVSSAFDGLARQPILNQWIQRYDDVLDQRIEERIQPGIMKIHDHIEQSLERSLRKLPSY